jgi:PRC-barrel domain
MPTEVSPNEHIMREPGSLQLDPSGEGVAIDETKRLIASNKVEGTPVYKRDGEQLGNVYNFMVDKYTGPGRLRRYVLRGLPRAWRKLPSSALEGPDLRHSARGLCH